MTVYHLQYTLGEKKVRGPAHSQGEGITKLKSCLSGSKDREGSLKNLSVIPNITFCMIILIGECHINVYFEKVFTNF